MILIKTKEEIDIMRESGKRLKGVFDSILPQIKPGVTKKEIDRRAEELILKLGGQPSFKMVPGYHWATCVTVNEEVVHGIPDEYVIKERDIISLDAGVLYGGFHTDKSWTVEMSNAKRQMSNLKFLQAGKLALARAIEAARPGKRVGHISLAIQKTIEGAGYTCIRDLTGHGVGRKLHEKPKIPCFLKDKLENTALLREGMTLAIEVIYCWGKSELALAEDGWTIITRDGKMAALFEETIAVTADSPLVLTDGSSRGD
jgi:methionyl aminopeptidase